MAKLRDTHLPQPDGPPNPSQFPSDSVLGRVARGGYKATDTDLEELRNLAQNGNRAERRAAVKYLKKQGIAAPPAAPRMPVVMPAVEASKERPVAVETAPSKPSPKKSTGEKPAAGKAAPTKAAAPVKAAPTEAAARKTATTKRAPVKSATKKNAVKKPANKKAAAKKAPAKTPRKK